MKPRHWILKTVFISLLIIFAAVAAAAQDSEQAPQTEIRFNRIAVAPVLVGRRIPNIDETLDDTLSCPINEICINDPTINPGAGDMLGRLIQSVLKERFGARVVPRQEVQDAYATLRLDNATETPRTLVQNLGKALPADLLVVATLWRYRERGAIQGVPDQPTSVGFALYLVDSAGGRRIWRGIFDQNQDFALNDLANFGNRIKMGLKWLSADELARYGVERTLKRFPEHVMPAAANAAPEPPPAQ